MSYVTRVGVALRIFRTVVLRHLVEKYDHLPQNAVIRLHFHYPLSRELTVMDLACFILSLLVRRRALKTTIDTLGPYHRHGQSRPSLELVIALLCDEIKTYDRIYLILDALDETSEDLGRSLRDFFVKKLPEQISILCTSRRHENIMNTFRDDKTIDITAHLEDLITYIAARFDSNSLLGRLSERSIGKVAVIDKIVERSGGM